LLFQALRLEGELDLVASSNGHTPPIRISKKDGGMWEMIETLFTTTGEWAKVALELKKSITELRSWMESHPHVSDKIPAEAIQAFVTGEPVTNSIGVWFHPSGVTLSAFNSGRFLQVVEKLGLGSIEETIWISYDAWKPGKLQEVTETLCLAREDFFTMALYYRGTLQRVDLKEQSVLSPLRAFQEKDYTEMKIRTLHSRLDD